MSSATTTGGTPVAPAQVGAADRFMKALLRANRRPQPGTVADAQRLMGRSIVISAVRCTLTYLVIPLAGPTVGIIGSIGTPIGALLCVLGIYSSTRSMRRFWMANHRLRWVYTAFATIIIVYLAASLIGDATQIPGWLNG